MNKVSHMKRSWCINKYILAFAGGVKALFDNTTAFSLNGEVMLACGCIFYIKSGMKLVFKLPMFQFNLLGK